MIVFLKISDFYFWKENVNSMQLVNELLIETVEVGDLEALKVLLENGADVNYENRYGNTPLMQAVEYGFLEVVNFIGKWCWC